ncbi:MAG TPA: Maf family protein [Candidatus Acidoferrales bacterium]
MKVILASASPRRAEILTVAGIPFVVRASKIDESRLPGESPENMVERLARAKAEDVARELLPAGPTIILGADTVVVVNGEILGKPGNAATAREMLLKLRGREHRVITGFALLRAQHKQIHVGHETTRVWFSEITDAEIDSYVATGEPFDKAGAYAIQGIAGRYIPRIEGCYFNVVGLPMARVWEAMKDLGWRTS